MSLRVEELVVTFGAVHAVDDVSLVCADGELTGLIGPNGAGKTTLIDAVTGFVSCEGSVHLNGRDLGKSSPCDRARMGLRRTWQSLELFDDITVLENLEVAVGGRLSFGLRRRTARRNGDLVGVLETLGIAELANELPRELPQGKRKLLGVARALAGEPDLLLLDEPAAGLDRAETRLLGRQLRDLADRGQTMLLVDHDMDLVLAVCDRVHVLKTGRLIGTGTPEEIRRDSAVRAAYLGSLEGDESQ